MRDAREHPRMNGGGMDEIGCTVRQEVRGNTAPNATEQVQRGESAPPLGATLYDLAQSVPQLKTGSTKHEPLICSQRSPRLTSRMTERVAQATATQTEKAVLDVYPKDKPYTDPVQATRWLVGKVKTLRARNVVLEGERGHTLRTFARLDVEGGDCEGVSCPGAAGTGLLARGDTAPHCRTRQQPRTAAP